MDISKYKHISFDLDGTLVHTTEEYRFKLVPFVIQKLGGHLKNKQDVNRFWFETDRDKIIYEDFGLEPRAFWDLFRKSNDPIERDSHTKAYSDAEPLLRRLKNKNKLISIITGSPNDIAKMEIKKLNQAPLDLYLSLADESLEYKPNPLGLLHAINLLQSTSEQTVYIGNSNEDAMFAKNAGVDFIYLERKEHTFDMRDYAKGRIETLAELKF